MKFEAVIRKLTSNYGRRILYPSNYPALYTIIYNAILELGPEACLELGTGLGVSSVVMAAALEENGKGYLVTLDKKSSLERHPTIFEVLETTELSRYVQPVIDDTSYNWTLMKMIEDNTKNNHCMPQFDFCLIDGAHTWETDGLAFFLVSKLLKKGGWVFFDDLEWTFERAPYMKERDFVKKMPQNQKETPQMKKVFELLVRQHPLFGNFEIDKTGEIGWCRKVEDR